MIVLQRSGVGCDAGIRRWKRLSLLVSIESAAWPDPQLAGRELERGLFEIREVLLT